MNIKIEGINDGDDQEEDDTSNLLIADTVNMKHAPWLIPVWTADIYSAA